VTDLTSWSDCELTAEADKAWQSQDQELAAAIKVEKARRARLAAITPARRAIRRAGIASCLFTGGSFYYAAMAILELGQPRFFLLLLIPIVLAFLTFQIFKGSRAAAIAMLGLYLIDIGASVTMKPASIIGSALALSLAYFLVGGIRGAFALCKLQAVGGTAA
jgi:hypothetical protein